MTYLKMVVNGGQSSSANGKEGFYLYEPYIATEGQTISYLLGEYRPGEYELEVHINGVRQTYEVDYREIDEHTIEFVESLEAGDRLLFTVRKAKSNTILHESHTPKAGQTVFNLTNSYHPGRNTLMVFDNGQLLTVEVDYIETNERTVTFTTPFDSFPHTITFHEVV